MEAYHIDRFDSIDGIVLCASADLRPEPTIECQEVMISVASRSPAVLSDPTR
jgi:hypothetical protein